jgi:hypothetical protein
VERKRKEETWKRGMSRRREVMRRIVMEDEVRAKMVVLIEEMERVERREMRDGIKMKEEAKRIKIMRRDETTKKMMMRKTAKTMERAMMSKRKEKIHQRILMMEVFQSTAHPLEASLPRTSLLQTSLLTTILLKTSPQQNIPVGNKRLQPSLNRLRKIPPFTKAYRILNQ